MFKNNPCCFRFCNEEKVTSYWKSIHSKNKVWVTFKNDTNEDITIFWKTYSGGDRAYANLRPGR